MKRITTTAAILVAVLTAPASAGFKITIEQASPVRAAPKGNVERSTIEQIPGTVVAPPTPVRTFIQTEEPLRIPVPVSNPLAVSWCGFETEHTE